MWVGFFHISSIKDRNAKDLFLVSFIKRIFLFLIPPKATVCICQFRLIRLNLANPKIRLVEYFLVLKIGERNIFWQF